AKSIVFIMQSTGEPVLIVASGTNRINEQTIAQEIDDTLGKATASFVKKKTGYSSGVCLQQAIPLPSSPCWMKTYGNMRRFGQLRVMLWPYLKRTLKNC